MTDDLSGSSLSFVEPEYLDQILRHQAETESLDYKSACMWDNGDESAKLTKDILALANSYKGGWIVIGVAEHPKGTFTHQGVSPEQAASFETSHVLKWVNARAEPPVSAHIFQRRLDGRLYVLIHVFEFSEVPAICRATVTSKASTTKTLLREGELYVRNSNAESIPATRAEHLRPLIGMATRKKRGELFELIQLALSGGAIPAEQMTKSIPDKAEEAKAIAAYLDRATGPLDAHGFVSSQLVPTKLGTALFDTEEKGISLLLRLYSQFHGLRVPYLYDSAARQSWGVAAADASMGFGLGEHGTWIERAIRWSEPAPGGKVKAHQESPIRQNGLTLGTYIPYLRTIYEATCRFALMAKLAALLGTQEIRVAYAETHLEGRRLVSLTADVFIDAEPCQASEFLWGKTFRANLFQQTWRTECTDCMFKLMDLLRSDVARTVIEKWVNEAASAIR